MTRVYGETDPSEYEYTVAAKSGSSLVAGDSASSTTFFTSSPPAARGGERRRAVCVQSGEFAGVRGGDRGEVHVRGGEAGADIGGVTVKTRPVDGTTSASVRHRAGDRRPGW